MAKRGPLRIGSPDLRPLRPALWGRDLEDMQVRPRHSGAPTEQKPIARPNGPGTDTKRASALKEREKPPASSSRRNAMVRSRALSELGSGRFFPARWAGLSAFAPLAHRRRPFGPKSAQLLGPKSAQPLGPKSAQLLGPKSAQHPLGRGRRNTPWAEVGATPLGPKSARRFGPKSGGFLELGSTRSAITSCRFGDRQTWRFIPSTPGTPRSPPAGPAVRWGGRSVARRLRLARARARRVPNPRT